MDMALIFRGFILGFAIAAPVGPIGLLCIQRTLNQGQLVGLASGLGAATADAFYGAVAAFGLTMVSAFLIDQQFWLALVGGLFLCYLGVRTLRASPPEQAAGSEARGIGGAYFSTFVLTITNPLTILSFVAIFAGAGLAAAAGGSLAAAWLVLGVFLGSAAWWFLLSGGVALLRTHIDTGVLLWINRAAGAILLIFGALAVGRAFTT
jgi:threonine/homoserine/homoserine lactone efflux protein